MTTAHSPWIAFAVIVLALGVSAIGMGTAIEAFGFHLRKMPIEPPGGRVLTSLPRETTRWIAAGSDRTESAETIEVLGTENYLNRTYIRRDVPDDQQAALDFHAAYYTGMIDTVPHVPERCFVGGGLRQAQHAQVYPLPIETGSWRLDETELSPELAEQFGDVYTIRLGYENSSAPGKRVRLPIGVGPDTPIQMRVSSFEGNSSRKIFAGYFFIANGGTVAHAQSVRTLAFDLTSDYAFYTKVQVTSQSVQTPEEFVELAGTLIGDLLGEIMLCVPDWIEVQQGLYPEDNPRRPSSADAG